MLQDSHLKTNANGTCPSPLLLTLASFAQLTNPEEVSGEISTPDFLL
jgi:hypothetical protein